MCNKVLNELFSIECVVSSKHNGGGRTIDRVLTRMRELDWNQSDLARRMGVGAADITNWKARGMPADKLEAASKAIGRSVDWILGREPKNAEQVIDRWPFDEVPFADFDGLDPEQQAEIGEIVEDRVRRFKAKNGPRRRKKSIED